jgi:ribosomal protein L40E
MSRFDRRDNYKYEPDYADGKQGHYHKTLDPMLEDELRIADRRRPVCLECGRYISGEQQVCRKCEMDTLLEGGW